MKFYSLAILKRSYQCVTIKYILLPLSIFVIAKAQMIPIGFMNKESSATAGNWVSIANSPVASSDTPGVWINSKLVSWDVDGTSTPYLYDLSADNWSIGSSSSAPTKGSGFSMVSTGSKMLVWGGATSPTANLNSGGLYDPVTNTWSSTTTSGAPAGRRNHSAVWTGSKMIIWGGTYASGAGYMYANGGIYDVATNSWATPSTSGAPTMMSGHLAVWTGTKMIVYASNTKNGIYDPVTNTWAAMSDVGAPNGSRGIWTGTRFLIVGFNFGTKIFEGSSYNPATDTWAPISSSGAPSFQNNFSIIWTGTKLVFWGGKVNIFNPSQDGFIYTEASDTWSSMTTINAPSARSEHIAIWTGSKMIIWSGRDGNRDDLATGGVYTP